MGRVTAALLGKTEHTLARRLTTGFIDYHGSLSNGMWLPNQIHCNVSPIEIANDLMDQKVHTFADHQAENKRKLDDNIRNNQTQQPPSKRQNVGRAYTVGPGEKKEYKGSLPRVTPKALPTRMRVIGLPRVATQMLQKVWPTGP
ncbi:hypothetical protein Tco_1273142 [Tanacetum coccineum]